MTGKRLKEYVATLSDNEEFCVDIWQEADVHQRCDELGETLTEEECRTVIDSMGQRLDATIGMNWDVMDVHIDSVLEDRE